MNREGEICGGQTHLAEDRADDQITIEKAAWSIEAEADMDWEVSRCSTNHT
jgi:hypothetical protein